MLLGSIMAGVPAGSLSATPAELPGDRVALRLQPRWWPNRHRTFFQARKKLDGFSPSKASDQRNLTRIPKRSEGVPSCDNGMRTGAAIYGGLTPSWPAIFPAVCSTRLVRAKPMNRPYEEPTRVQKWSESMNWGQRPSRMKRVIERLIMESENSVIPPWRDGHTGQVLLHLKLSERG